MSWQSMSWPLNPSSGRCILSRSSPSPSTSSSSPVWWVVSRWTRVPVAVMEATSSFRFSLFFSSSSTWAGSRYAALGAWAGSTKRDQGSKIKFYLILISKPSQFVVPIYGTVFLQQSATLTAIQRSDELWSHIYFTVLLMRNFYHCILYYYNALL